MDSFFSAVEVRENQEMKGLPVIVGGRIRKQEKAAEEPDMKIRGVVSTCSYEAREYGVHSAMPLSRAYKLCPDAKFLPVNMPLYKRVSREIKFFYSDLSTLRKTAKELMTEFSEEKGEKKKKIRLVGVRVSTLVGVNEKQRRIVAFSASDMFF